MSEAIPVDWISISGYWDGPLSGWIRVQGTRFWFEVVDADAEDRQYLIFVVPLDEQLAAMRRLRQWRQLVGWHMERKPGGPRSCFNIATHPNYRDYYALPPLPPFSSKIPVGTTNLEHAWFGPE